MSTIQVGVRLGRKTSKNFPDFSPAKKAGLALGVLRYFNQRHSPHELLELTSAGITAGMSLQSVLAHCQLAGLLVFSTHGSLDGTLENAGGRPYQFVLTPEGKRIAELHGNQTPRRLLTKVFDLVDTAMMLNIKPDPLEKISFLKVCNAIESLQITPATLSDHHLDGFKHSFPKFYEHNLLKRPQTPHYRYRLTKKGTQLRDLLVRALTTRQKILQEMKSQSPQP